MHGVADLAVLAGAGPLAATALLFAAALAFIASAAVVLLRRTLWWVAVAAGASGLALVVLIHAAGGVATHREDAIAVAVVCGLGTAAGVAPFAYARWVRRTFRDAERRLTSQR